MKHANRENTGNFPQHMGPDPLPHHHHHSPTSALADQHRIFFFPQFCFFHGSKWRCRDYRLLEVWDRLTCVSPNGGGGLGWGEGIIFKQVGIDCLAGSPSPPAGASEAALAPYIWQFKGKSDWRRQSRQFRAICFQRRLFQPASAQNCIIMEWLFFS